MSGTDSDLDFQSADEDTESDVNSQSTSEKPAVTESSPNVVECPEKSTEHSSVEPPIEPSIIKDEQLSKSEQPEEKVENIDTEILSSTEAKENVETKSSVSDADTVEKTKKEKQRVPLRLEKKIQQKTQLPKEPLVESCETPKEDVAAPESNENTAANSKEKSSWGFGSWGSSLLSTAASSVSTFSSQVSQGIGTVLETVESSLGAPSPEELAAVLKEKKGETVDIPDEEVGNEEVSGSGLLGDVSSWTKVLESTGSKVIMGGLDTLELIGKKTIDILTEGDPGLRKKRTGFSDGSSLSEILREAKEKADELAENVAEEDGNIHYSQAFDDYQGLVHLEALEMLSKQAQVKLQRLLIRHSKDAEVKKKLEKIKSVFEDLPTYDDPSEFKYSDDFELGIKQHVSALSIPLNVDNIITTQKRLHNAICEFDGIKSDGPVMPNDIFQSSIRTLAEFTARCIETFHKIAELILVQPKLESNIEWATTMSNLSNLMCVEINCFANKYQKCLDKCVEIFPDYKNSQDLNITAMITNVYVEASNSNKYIQDALLMLIPILQVFLLENLEL